MEHKTAFKILYFLSSLSILTIIYFINYFNKNNLQVRMSSSSLQKYPLSSSSNILNFQESISKEELEPKKRVIAEVDYSDYSDIGSF